VLVVVPLGNVKLFPSEKPLAAAVEELRAGGAVVATVAPDEASRAAIGANQLDPSTRKPAAEAGRALEASGVWPPRGRLTRTRRPASWLATATAVGSSREPCPSQLDLLVVQPERERVSCSDARSSSAVGTPPENRHMSAHRAGLLSGHVYEQVSYVWVELVSSCCGGAWW